MSVIIPCYNQGRYLPDAVASLQAQTYPHWSAIIVNDGSTDDSGRIAEQLAASESRVSVVHQENRGLAGARNRGLEEVCGGYIQFLDADDALAPEKFAVQVGALRERAAPCASYSFFEYQDARGRAAIGELAHFERPELFEGRPVIDLAKRWETELSIPIHCFLFDSRLFAESGIRFDETLPNHEDWDCWMTLFGRIPTPIAIRQVLAYYRLHEQSMCVDRESMWLGFSRAIRKHIRRAAPNPYLNLVLRSKLREMRLIYKGVAPLPVALASGAEGASRALGRLYAKSVPWPLQRAVARVAGHRGSGK